MGEPKTMTPSRARHVLMSRFDEVDAIRRYDPRRDPGLSTEDAAICIAADLLLQLEALKVERDRQIRRLRLELACERGEDGPWTALGWRFDFACWGWRDDEGRDACIHEPDESGTSVWSAGDGGKMRRVGGAQTSLAAIEQACDALGIQTPWERG